MKISDELQFMRSRGLLKRSDEMEIDFAILQENHETPQSIKDVAKVLRNILNSRIQNETVSNASLVVRPNKEEKKEDVLSNDKGQPHTEGHSKD